MFQLAQRRPATQIAPLIALLAVLMLVLTACSGGGGKETVTTFTKNDSGADITMTYYASGDEVTKQTTKTVVDYKAAGLTDKATAKAAIDPMMKSYEGVEGVEHSVDYGDDSATETTTVDYKVADLSEVAKLTGSSATGYTGKGSKVSLKESEKMLEASGFKKEK